MIFSAVDVIHRGKIVGAWVGLWFFYVYFGFFLFNIQGKIAFPGTATKTSGSACGFVAVASVRTAGS